MGLRKALGYSGLQTGVTLVTAFASVKVTSVFLGPDGIGALSLMLLFTTLIVGVVGPGMNKGIVRFTAQLGDDAAARDEFVATMIRLVVGIGLVLGLVVVVSSRWIAERVLHDERFWNAVLVFGLVVPLALLGATSVGLANGLRSYKAVALINITAAVCGLLLFSSLCPTLGVAGGMLAAALAPLGAFVAGLVLVRRAGWWPKHLLRRSFSLSTTRAVLVFVPAAAVLAIGGPVVQLLLRDDLIQTTGLSAVGYVQSISRVSDMYLGAFLSISSMYFQPRFARVKSAPELLQVFGRAVKIMVPGLVVVSLTIYLLRDLVIRIVFTPEFAPMSDLFGWQMIGNVFRGVCWLLSYALLAKLHWLAVTLIDASILPVWWGLGVLLIPESGAIGAVQAYTFTFCYYAIIGAAGFMFVHYKLKRSDAALKG